MADHRQTRGMQKYLLATFLTLCFYSTWGIGVSNDTIFLKNGDFIVTDTLPTVAKIQYKLNGKTIIWIAEIESDKKGNVKSIRRFAAYPSGQKATEDPFFIQHFNKNGFRTEELGVYQESGKDSVRREFFKNGMLFEEIYYLGSDKYRKNSFDETGIQTGSGEYAGEKKHGIVRIYHDNGKEKMTMRYEMDRPWQVISVKDNNGNELDTGTLTDGTGTLKIYSPDGELVQEEKYVHGIRVKAEKQ